MAEKHNDKPVPWLRKAERRPEPKKAVWPASDCDDQLPIFSRVGRGLKGDSLSASFETDADGHTYLVVTTTAADSSTVKERRRIDGGVLRCYYAYQDSMNPTTFTLTFVYDGSTPDSSWAFTTPAIPYHAGEEDPDWGNFGIPRVFSVEDIAKILGISPANLEALAGSDIIPVELLPEDTTLKEYIDSNFDEVDAGMANLQEQIDGIEVGLPHTPLWISDGGTGTDENSLEGNKMIIYDGGGGEHGKLVEVSAADARDLLGIEEISPESSHFETDALALSNGFGWLQMWKYGKVVHLVISYTMTTPSSTRTIGPGEKMKLFSGSVGQAGSWPEGFAPATNNSSVDYSTRGFAFGEVQFAHINRNTSPQTVTRYPSMLLKVEGLQNGAELYLVNESNSNVTLTNSSGNSWSINGHITYLTD